MTTTTRTQMRELAHRAADGVEVALLWHTATNALVVAVDDARSGDSFQLAVESAHALDAFEHPYAYAAHRGLEYTAGARETVYA
jgi:hypothetical protein